MDRPDLLREFAPIDSQQPTTDELVIGCSDFKLQDAYRAILANRGVKKPDVIKRPGPSLKIAAGEMTEDITDLHELHELSTIHVMDHMPCGKFKVNGEYKDVTTEEEMLEVHERKLGAARALLHEVLPTMTIVTYVLNSEEIVSQIQWEPAVVQVR